MMNLDLETLLKFIKDYPAISGLIATGTNILIFTTGLFLGNRLAIGRDKRKEYNESVLPIHTKLINQVEDLKRNKYKPHLLKKDELIGFSIYLSKRKAEKFIESINEYEQCFETKLQPIDPFEDKGLHYVTYAKDINMLKKATEKLLLFCKRR